MRRFGSVTALENVSVAVRPGEFFSLLGPSGCGKTTLLRLIAGLDLPDAGRLRIGGVDALPWPAHRRPVNTVFQSYALFPHLDVWNNVAFGLRMKRVARDQLRSRVQQALDLVQIADLTDRRPAQLSGGQRQRVALARAIVNEPSVLLLDEPLGALDLQLRRQLQVELRALQRRLGMTFIHVTHDQDEALAMSDRVAVMQAGRIVQLGEPGELYARPRTRFVAGFLGECNLLASRRCPADLPPPDRPPSRRAAAAVPAQAASGGPLGLQALSSPASLADGPVRSARNGGDDACMFETPVGQLLVAHFAQAASRPVPCPLTLAIRPERLRLLPPGTGGGPNRVAATVREAVYSGPETRYVLDAGGAILRARVMNSDNGQGVFRVGDPLTVEVPPDALVPLDD